MPARKVKEKPLRRLSGREIEAHASMGGAWGEGSVPRQQTLEALALHGISGELAQRIIEGSWDSLGRYGMDANILDKRLTPKEIVAQARMTAEIAKELERRLRFMEPNIRGMALGRAFSAWGERIVSPAFQDDLIRLQVLMEWVAGEVDARARKTVTKRTGPRNRLLAEVSQVIENACPEVSKERCREIASDLLRCWGVQAPTADRKLRAAVARTK